MQKFDARDNVPSSQENSYEHDNQGYADLLNLLFSQLRPQDVENFYACYQQWSLRQRLKLLQEQTVMLQSQIIENEQQMQALAPSPIAQAVLARLQSLGVQDIDLLDRMLERGDDWLDHSMQLLEQCERLNFIQDNDYTRWCEHALEGAYDWVASMYLPSNRQDIPKREIDARAQVEEHISSQSLKEVLPEVTEEQLLQKLMSEDEPTEHIVAARTPPKITQPLPVMKITQPLPPFVEAGVLSQTEHNESLVEESPVPHEERNEPLVEEQQPSEVEGIVENAVDKGMEGAEREDTPGSPLMEIAEEQKQFPPTEEQEEQQVPMTVGQASQGEEHPIPVITKTYGSAQFSASSTSPRQRGFIWRLFHLFAR